MVQTAEITMAWRDRERCLMKVTVKVIFLPSSILLLAATSPLRMPRSVVPLKRWEYGHRRYITSRQPIPYTQNTLLFVDLLLFIEANSTVKFNLCTEKAGSNNTLAHPMRWNPCRPFRGLCWRPLGGKKSFRRPCSSLFDASRAEADASAAGLLLRQN